jgi:hypothetical protein
MLLDGRLDAWLEGINKMKRWIGRSIVGVGLIHSLFGLVSGSRVLSEMAQDGLVASVNGQPLREAIFWFLFFGFLVILFGLLVDWVESKGLNLPFSMSLGLLVMTLFGVALMPASGWWLMLVPSIGMLVRARAKTAA